MKRILDETNTKYGEDIFDFAELLKCKLYFAALNILTV